MEMSKSQILQERTPLMKTPCEKAMQGKWDEMADYFVENRRVKYPIIGYPVTIAEDTAFHLAVHSKKEKPLTDLLDVLNQQDESMGQSSSHQSPIVQKNSYGNTVLHEAAINGNFEAAKLLKDKYPCLLSIKNVLGETPFFTAAAYGKTKIVEELCLAQGILDDEFRFAEVHRQRNNSTTILQATIHGTHFGLPLEDDEHDENAMDAISSLVALGDSSRTRWISTCFNPLLKGWPSMENFLNNKKKHKFALKLAELIIRKQVVHQPRLGIIVDLSSDFNEPSSYEPPENKNGGSKDVHISPDDEYGQASMAPPALLIATSNVIVEIVQEILKQHPQHVEVLNELGQNILHIAVMHRQKKIYDVIKHMMKLPLARLNRWIDNSGYTVLHQVANTKHYTEATKAGPALRLQDELRWFKRIEKRIPSHYLQHCEYKKDRTAKRMFEETHKELLNNEQQWIKDTSKSCSTVAVLVASVVFAAAYTVPGDYNTKGIPNFLSNRFFMVFTVFDFVSLASSLTSLVIFLSILTSPLELYDFHRSLPGKVMFGLTLLFFSVLTTMVTFGSTIAILVQSDKKRTAILISVPACVPVAVFALMLLKLYIPYLSAVKECLKPIRKFLPWFLLPSLRREKKIP
ncbi:unnamed protein product [Dovyalis caffra]|uniref:PGG domain-containing protein n=1 Tax=Dovyalis caffra TaxID=77055 RepID=A0AAV1SME9_9ROSI|nr:unnamed protein product [Dovyalis caffra]